MGGASEAGARAVLGGMVEGGGHGKGPAHDRSGVRASPSCFPEPFLAPGDPPTTLTRRPAGGHCRHRGRRLPPPS